MIYNGYNTLFWINTLNMIQFNILYKKYIILNSWTDIHQYATNVADACSKGQNLFNVIKNSGTLSELVQLKLNIGTSVGDSTPTEAGIRNPHLEKWGSHELDESLIFRIPVFGGMPSHTKISIQKGSLLKEEVKELQYLSKNQDPHFYKWRVPILHFRWSRVSI